MLLVRLQLAIYYFIVHTLLESPVPTCRIQASRTVCPRLVHKSGSRGSITPSLISPPQSIKQGKRWLALFVRMGLQWLFHSHSTSLLIIVRQIPSKPSCNTLQATSHCSNSQLPYPRSIPRGHLQQASLCNDNKPPNVSCADLLLWFCYPFRTFYRDLVLHVRLGPEPSFSFCARLHVALETTAARSLRERKKSLFSLVPLSCSPMIAVGSGRLTCSDDCLQ